MSETASPPFTSLNRREIPRQVAGVPQGQKTFRTAFLCFLFCMLVLGLRIRCLMAVPVQFEEIWNQVSPGKKDDAGMYNLSDNVIINRPWKNTKRWLHPVVFSLHTNQFMSTTFSLIPWTCWYGRQQEFLHENTVQTILTALKWKAKKLAPHHLCT